jgi:hypothetical protein
MSTGIAASDRKLLLIGGGLLLVLLTASVVLAPPSERFNSPVPSTYSAGSHGAEAAYRLLLKLNYPIRRWENPPTELDTDSSNILLILAEPSQPPSANERRALAAFVEAGGHVLFTGANIQSYFPDANVSSERADPAWQSFRPNIPSVLSRGVQHVALQPQTYWGQLSASQLSIYGEPGSPAVVSWLLGDGQIVWWAGSTPLTNAGISREDNLAFFLNAVTNWSADEPYTIYWDEYFHGERSSLWSYVQKTSLAWGVLQVALLAAAVLFTFSRRNGPTYVPAEVSRLSPLEFVETLGGLYERAGATSSAISVSYMRLRSLLARQLGFASDTPNAQLVLAAEQRLGWKGSALGESLRRAEIATQGAKLRPREALELVKDLGNFAARLNVRAHFHRGKT